MTGVAHRAGCQGRYTGLILVTAPFGVAGMRHMSTKRYSACKYICKCNVPVVLWWTIQREGSAVTTRAVPAELTGREQGQIDLRRGAVGAHSVHRCPLIREESAC